jgi:hypothetical protein
MTQLIVTLENALKFTDDRDRTWSIAGRRDPVANNIVIDADGEIGSMVQKHLDDGLGWSFETWSAEDRAAQLQGWKNTVTSFADSLADQITGPIPTSEKLSWDRKYVAAAAYKTGYEAANNDHTAGVTAANTTDPIGWLVVSTEESITNEGMYTLANRILTRAGWFAVAAGAISGTRRKTLAALDVMNTTNPNWTNDDAAAIVDAAKANALTQFQSIMSQNPGD